LTTAVPVPTAVTTPLDETVATALLNDTHVAMLVTSCVVPSLNVTVEVNCEVEPVRGTVPVTLMLDNVVADTAVELLHADTHTPVMATGRHRTSERNRLPFMTAPQVASVPATVAAGTVRLLNCVKTIAKM
jgi:hypothetical protein